MSTTLIAFVLTTQVIAFQETPSVSWNRDYGKAQRLGTSQSKPLAVFVGSGAQGWNQLVREGNLSAEIQDVIQANYIPVYIDTATPEGKSLANAFEITGGKGLVLSDRKGTSQAFWHEGNLTSQNLLRQLQTFGPGSLNRTSFYDAGTATLNSGPGVTLPASTYCPTCNGGGRRR